MKIRNFGLAILLSLIALPAFATVKVYSAEPNNGTPGDDIQFSTTLCPPIQTTAGNIQGSYTITDTGGGTVSMTGLDMRAVTLVSVEAPLLDGVFGPGSFVFVNAVPISNIDSALPVAATGSTAPGGSVAWGVVSGWVNTGIGFCIASPQTICTSATMLPHGVTTPVSPPDSPTYDLGTWSFDATTGDMEATSSYITGTNQGGQSNRQRLLRGAYVGASVPALPLIGAGALAIALVVAGSRTMMRRK